MAVPTSGEKLSQVITEMASSGTYTKLTECITNAIVANLDGTYYTAPLDRLSDFRNYSHATTNTLAWTHYSTYFQSGSYLVVVVDGVQEVGSYQYGATTNSGTISSVPENDSIDIYQNEYNTGDADLYIYATTAGSGFYGGYQGDSTAIAYHMFMQDSYTYVYGHNLGPI